MNSFPHLLIFLTLLSPIFPIKLSNLQPRYDSSSQLMDVHDGNILQIPSSSTYFFYGMGYGSCQNPLWGCLGVFGLDSCGFQFNHSINLYISNDLANWTFISNVLPEEDRPNGIYFRPKVIYDSRRNHYVLWVNRVNGFMGLPNYLDADLLVAVSNTPEGPFTVITEQAKTKHGNPGDFTVFIDDDLKGYLIYDSFNTNHKVSIEQLTDDYLDVADGSASVIVSDVNNEAPIFFKRNGVYYLLYGQCCCFCTTGSNSVVKFSSNPMGPFTDPHIDIDPFSGSFFGGSSVTKGQQSFVLEVREKSKSEDTYVLVSDRWGRALDGEK